jgi:transposase
MNTTDARRARGAEMANGAAVRKLYGACWIVTSATGVGSYAVNVEEQSCTCPDHETNAMKCKHLHAVEFVMRETVTEIATNAAGVTTTTETTREVRVKYTQNWPAYNAAQQDEKEHVGALLRGLCDGIVTPTQVRGRPRLPLSDLAHSAAMKVYSGMSGRRATTDIRACEARGEISRAPHYNSVHNFIERADVTELLKTLVEEAAAPLKSIETRFAVDSTGFSTCVYRRWYDHKYGREMSENRWIKCHAMIGTVTNVITSVEVTESNANDSPELPGLVAKTAKRFDIEEVSADKAYLSHANLAAVEAIDAVPYIPFKSNSQGEGPAAWRRAWHTFSLQRETFLRHYHARSNVETTFSAVKRLFGGAVRAKLPVAQKNEVLLKCLVYNVTCLVHAMYELGLEPTFPAVVAATVLQ